MKRVIVAIATTLAVALISIACNHSVSVSDINVADGGVSVYNEIHVDRGLENLSFSSDYIAMIKVSYLYGPYLFYYFEIYEKSEIETIVEYLNCLPPGDVSPPQEEGSTGGYPTTIELFGTTDSSYSDIGAVIITLSTSDRSGFDRISVDDSPYYDLPSSQTDAFGKVIDSILASRYISGTLDPMLRGEVIKSPRVLTEG